MLPSGIKTKQQWEGGGPETGWEGLRDRQLSDNRWLIGFSANVRGTELCSLIGLERSDTSEVTTCKQQRLQVKWSLVQSNNLQNRTCARILVVWFEKKTSESWSTLVLSLSWGQCFLFCSFGELKTHTEMRVWGYSTVRFPSRKTKTSIREGSLYAFQSVK